MTTAPPVQNPTPNTTVAGKIALAALALTVVGWLIYIEFTGGLDFNVYRLGAMTIFDNEGMHKDLYARDLLDYGALKLPFTYPPFAALLFMPFAFLPFGVGVGIMYTISIGVAWWMATLIYDYATSRGYHIPFQDKLGRYGTIAVLTFIIILSGPWRRGLALVQVNPIILILVLADFLRPAKRIPRGALIGIAGGIKLTPLAFGLILLMRKDWRGIFTLGASFAATVIIGFIFLPHEALTFWTSAVSDPSRVGNINFLDNISIQGWLMHLGLRDPLLKPAYYGLVLVTIVLFAALLHQLNRRKLVLSQVAVGGFLMVSISPISWSHHNVMFPLILMALIVDAFPRFYAHLPAWANRAARILTWVALIGLYISPMWLGASLWGSFSDLDNIYQHALLFSTVPILCLYLVMITWAVAALTPAVRTADEDDLFIAPPPGAAPEAQKG